MLDWTRLRSYQAAPSSSFEELCYQIARAEYGTRGTLLSIDDSGGGDGVEFYLELPTGDIWGWQAKFYPNERLTAGRRAQIIKSLKRAVAVHGAKLKRWYLCVPLNLVPKGKNSEASWWKETLPKSAPGVELVFWGESELFARLQEPGREGIRACFFGDLPLNPAWFKARLDEQLANVRDKYDAALHTETAVDAELHALLGDAAFNEALAAAIGSVQTATDTLGGAVERLRIEAARAPAAGAVTNVRSGQLAVNGAEGAVEAGARLPFLITVANAATVMRERMQAVHAASGADLRDRRAEVQAAFDAWKAFHAEVDRYLDAFKSPDGRLPDLVFETIDTADASVNRVVEASRIHHRMLRLLDSELNVLGDAGAGKTHVSCNAVRAAIDRGAPALLLLGGQFNSAVVPHAQILERLQVPGEWDTFLGALDAYAAARRTRGLIVIDALNEAQSSDFWRLNLPGLAATIARHPRLAFVTTCRPLYRDAIWGAQTPAKLVEAWGFSGTELYEAVAKYFTRYKIIADLRLASLAPFRLPIYLALFCRAKNESAAVERHVILGEQTLYEVFDEYIGHADTIIRSRLNRRGAAYLIQPKLSLVAEMLWERKLRALPFEDACVALDGTSAVDLLWEGSVTQAVLNEGLLLRRDVSLGGAGDVVAFSYDLLAGYEVAKHLVAGKTLTDVQALVASPAFSSAVASAQFGERHPLAEDVLRGLAALLPSLFSVPLYRLSKDPTIYSAGIKALFDSAARHVSADDSAEVRRLMLGSPDNVAIFAQLSRGVALVPGHPLNAEFFDRALREFSLPERDVAWTEAVRESRSVWQEEVEEFERACRDTGLHADPITNQRIHLGAIRYQWLLTSTNRMLRDLTTRALYWYGRRDPRALFGLAISSFEVDDPYVRERLLAAAYGVAMARHADPEHGAELRTALPDYALRLFELMFAPGAPNATTHALIRDYARHTVALALRQRPDLLTREQAALTVPPFAEGGIREWGESEDRNAGEYRNGNSPFGLDFGNYTVGRLVPDRAPYDAKHPEYQRVLRQMWWRMYDLGYSLDRFGRIDQLIASENPLNRSEDNASRTDRYGKKYAWIAYFEQYGFREDRDELLSDFDREWPDPRPSEIDIDPGFPEAPAEVAFVPDDLLGDRGVDLDTWMREGPGPDFEPYLVMEELDGEVGPWVLLDGYVAQEDMAADRSVFGFPRGLLIPAHQTELFSQSLAAQRLGGRWLPEVPEDHYLFAGEIPWNLHYPANGWTSIRFGERHAKPWESRADDFNILLPVRNFGWESYHSGAVGSYGAYVPAREVAEPLGLWIALPKWDFHDPAGRRVARYVVGHSYGGRHHGLFVRRDALNQVLEASSLSLVWGVWGERRVARHEHVMARKHNNSDYVDHQSVYIYDGVQPRRVEPLVGEKAPRQGKQE